MLDVGSVYSRRLSVGKKLTSLMTGGKNKVKSDKKGSDRGSSRLVQVEPTIDFSDRNQVEEYLRRETMESIELLSKLGGFMKKCETAIMRL